MHPACHDGPFPRFDLSANVHTQSYVPRPDPGGAFLVKPPSPPRQNWLLSALADPEWDRIAPHLQPVSLALGHVLCEPGDTMSHVYFPTTAIVSLLYVMEDGASAEIAVVGNEGVVGISLFMGGQSTSSQAVVQAAGAGFRLPAGLLMQEFNRGGAVMHLLLRYTQALITQMAQTSVCNRHHAVHQQVCRWLLLTLDRLPSNEVVMTQDLLSTILGVRRASISDAAGRLQRDGIIHYDRGRMTVLDRPELERRTCECYAVVRREYDRLLPDIKAV